MEMPSGRRTNEYALAVGGTMHGELHYTISCQVSFVIKRILPETNEVSKPKAKAKSICQCQVLFTTLFSRRSIYEQTTRFNIA